MMIGIGTPSNQSNIERPIFVSFEVPTSEHTTPVKVPKIGGSDREER